MAVRSGLVALLFVTLAFAGCISGDEGGDVETATTNDTLNTEAPEGRETIVAFEETNVTEEGSGGVDHHHDYWQGRTRVVIFEYEAMMRPMGAEEAVGYEAAATFHPPQGTFVYEGTASVEFTLQNPRRHVCEGEFTLGGFYVCTSTLDEYGFPEVPPQDDPAGGPSGLKLRYKHASTVNWIDAGEVTWGTPVIIKVTDAIQTDMPHATSSAWEFQVISPHKEDSTLVFDAKAEIVKGEGDIPLWPGHPNFYAEQSWRKVLDNYQAVACDDGFGAAACTLAGGDAGPVSAQKLISYGTRSLHVWINITDFQAPNPATRPANFFLWHWNTTGRDNVTDVRDDDHMTDQMEHYWVLPVDDGGMDSPYADGSKWEFMLGGTLRAGLSCYGGCAEWYAKYSITVIATNVDLPLAEYDMYCLRDDYCPEPEGGGDGRERNADLLGHYRRG